jgi:arylformamidase
MPPSAAETPALPSRRGAILAGGGILTALASAAGAECVVGPASHPKGPAVFLDYDQVELDAAYDQSAYAPNMRQLLKRWVSNSELARRRLGPPRRFAYGKTEIEALDVFPTKRPNAPIFVMIHGGAWRAMKAADMAFPAELFVEAGVHYVVPDFSPVQDVGGSLVAMADQVRRAIVWVHANAHRFGGNRDRIYVAGQSSGGHLAAVALTTDWHKDFGLPPDLIKGGFCISGIYDLAPVRLSQRSAYVKFDDAMVEAVSPIWHISNLRTPSIVAHGTDETPEFQRQSRDFAAAAKAAGKPVETIVAENYGHFDLPETLMSPYGILGRAVLKAMRL